MNYAAPLLISAPKSVPPMTRAYALLASLLLIATPLAGCTSSPEIEEIVDDILGCMDENAENYAENATAELLGDCIYLVSMEAFMTAMTEQMEIDEMLDIIPQAGYSMSITMSEWNTDMNMQTDTVIEEMVMADLDTDSVYVKMGMSMVPFMTYEYTQVQVGELVNVHYTMGGMMAGENAGMGSYQTRDADPDVMDVISSLVSVSDPGEMNEMLDLPTCDVSDLSSEMPADTEPVITFEDETGVHTMTLEYTNDTGHDITIVTLIDENEDLMSYEISTDNGSATSSVAYTAMWGDAVVIEVDDTLPRTSIPINFHVEGMPEDNWDDDDDGGDDTFYCDNGNEISRDLVDDGWDDCGDGSDESDDGGDDGAPPTPEEAMAQVDTDGDDYMSYQEFQDAWESDPENPELDSEEVATLFDDCDYDGNDLIDIDEMQCFIDGIGVMLGGFGDDGGDDDDPDPEQMMDYMDTDDDGYLSLQELIDYLNNDREQNGEPPMSSEDEEGTANWFYSGDTDGDDLLSLDEFTQLLESTGDDDGGDDGNDVYWQSYEGGHCEWEGDADGEENAWYCKWEEETEWNTWWYYCENHDSDWHCTDDFGQSEDYEHSADGTEWCESFDCGDDGDDDGAPTPEEAMEAADANEDGYVSLQEFEDFWESDPSNPELDSEEVAALFDDCDYDDNDLIDINEMQCFIDGIGAMLGGSDEDPEQMMDYMDTDDDGYLSLQELIDYLNNDREQNGEPPMSSEDEEGTANWFYSGDTDGDDLLSLDEFAQLLESTGDDDDGDDGNDVYWQSYEGGHCEWEGDADGEENAWYCKYSEDDEDWDTWWYYCEDHEDDGWHCTDDFGQSEDYEYTSGGNEWSGSDDDDDDGAPTPEEAMEAADANEDGYVSFQEFEDFWESDPSNPELDSDSIAALWDDCDYDGNDMIDINEVQCVIDGIGDMFDPGEANPEQIFDWMDANEDGQLTASEWADFDNQTGGEGEEMSEEDFDGLSDIIDMFDDDDSGGLDWYEFEIFWAFCCADDDDGDDGDGEGGDDEPFRVTMMVMGQTLNAPISDFEVRFLVDCGEPDEEDNEPPISDCTVAASNGLTEGSATVDPAIAEYEFTYEYLDYDGDGLISDMDTLVIDNLMPGVQVELYDTWADQYTSESFATAEMLPGFGALMAVVVLLGAALATRRD